MVRLAMDAEASFTLSPLHAMLEQVSVGDNVEELNRVLNHPEVHDWVCGETVGPIDAGEILEPNCAEMVTGEHGSAVFVEYFPGLWDMHMQVVPEGRGKWALLFGQAAVHLLFTITNAVEIMMKRPHGNLPCRAMIKRLGGEYRFTNDLGYVYRHKPIPADVYSLTLQRWIETAPGLQERGLWSHKRLTSGASYHGVDLDLPSDEMNLRHLGSAFETVMMGRTKKGLMLYNRWAYSSGLGPAHVTCQKPLTVDLGSAIIIVRPDDIWVPTCQLQQSQE